MTYKKPRDEHREKPQILRGHYVAKAILFTPALKPLNPLHKTSIGTGYSELWEKVRIHRAMFEKIHPFSISLAGFLRIGSEQKRILQSQVGRTFKKLLEKEWNEGTKQVIICDGEIVYRTEDEEEIISEIIQEKARAFDKPCYAFSAPAAIEESAWIQVADDDYYPTIDVELSPVEPSSPARAAESLQITADFDTGNQMNKLFSAEQIGDLLGPIDDMDWELTSSGPWGGEWRFARKPAVLSVIDESGTRHQLRCSVQLVEKWETSRVIRFNKNRKGFVGRDLLRRLVLKVELNPVAKRTRVFPAS